MSIGNFPKIPKIAFTKAYDDSKSAKNAICRFLNEFSLIFDDFSNVLGINGIPAKNTPLYKNTPSY